MADLMITLLTLNQVKNTVELTITNKAKHHYTQMV